MKKYINIIFIFMMGIITIMLLFRNNDIESIINLLNYVDKKYIFFSLLCIFMYLLLEALMLYKMLNVNKKETSFLLSIKSMIIGQFYSLITPSASGGQPMQLIDFVSNKIEAGFGTTVLVNKFLYFQLNVTLYTIILFILRYKFIKEILTLKDMYLIFFSIIINTLLLFSLIFIILKSNYSKKIVDILIKFFKTIFKNDEKLKKYKMNSYKYIDDVSNSIKYFVGKKIFIELMVLTFVQLISYFSIIYFIYRAFGYSENNYIDILTLSFIYYISIAMVPTPGNVGVAESGFLLLFKAVFEKKYLELGLLMHRGITYYLLLIITGILLFIFDIKKFLQK